MKQTLKRKRETENQAIEVDSGRQEGQKKSMTNQKSPLKAMKEADYTAVLEEKKN